MGLIGPFLPYIIAGVVALGVLGTTYYKGREAGKEVERAELAPKLTACEGREKGLQGQIEVQNRAVEALKTEGEARVARATKGLQEATKAAQGARSEAQRLRGLATVSAPLNDPSAGCTAAVGEIRRGLAK